MTDTDTAAKILAKMLPHRFEAVEPNRHQPVHNARAPLFTRPLKIQHRHLRGLVPVTTEIDLTYEEWAALAEAAIKGMAMTSVARGHYGRHEAWFKHIGDLTERCMYEVRQYLRKPA